MQKVVTINLNGQAYQFDEDAYEAIQIYLDRAEAQLHDNPDRAEILADLEQAIADKCRRYLNAHKAVIAATEIRQVLEAMGPVEAADSAEQKSDGSTSGPDEQARSTTAATSVDTPLAADDAVSAAGSHVGTGAAFSRLRDACRRRPHDVGACRRQPAALSGVSVWLDFVDLDRWYRDVASA